MYLINLTNRLFCLIIMVVLRVILILSIHITVTQGGLHIVLSNAIFITYLLKFIYCICIVELIKDKF